MRGTSPGGSAKTVRSQAQEDEAQIAACRPCQWTPTPLRGASDAGRRSVTLKTAPANAREIVDDGPSCGGPQNGSSSSASLAPRFNTRRTILAITRVDARIANNLGEGLAGTPDATQPSCPTVTPSRACSSLAAERLILGFLPSSMLDGFSEHPYSMVLAACTLQRDDLR
ncbi:hypothetical protein B0H17DRAFT_1213713 [Mycena rosella]|uniref:Uncharacterized protein n=1 Tax=Mycena rosella TaxID=1033263 RepID=A0AAD7CPL6_MYCRO|nr:hypothetical protein B0H17DRAFT_1213713 [Mycena rosella]